MGLFDDLFGDDEPELDIISSTTQPMKSKFAKPRPSRGRDIRGGTNRSTFDDPAMDPKNMPTIPEQAEGDLTDEEPKVMPMIAPDTYYGPVTPPQFQKQPTQEPAQVETHEDVNEQKALQDAQAQVEHSVPHTTEEIKTTTSTVDESGRGSSEDAPTYQGKHNRNSQIAVKVVDALGDSLVEYLLKGNNRRRLGSMGWNVGDVIPQVLSGDAAEVMNKIGFANSFMSSPQAAMAGAAMTLAKRELDKMPGTNPFEAESQVIDKKTEGMRNIHLFRDINEHLTKDLKGQSLVDKAKHFLQAKAAGAANKGLNRMVLKSTESEEKQFITNPVVMPFIIIVIVFYVALKKKDLDVRQYHGVLRDFMMNTAVKTILNNVLGDNKTLATFGIDILEAIPQELIVAFKRNIEAKAGVEERERIVIDKFIKYILDTYKTAFKTDFVRDVRKFQGSNIDLVSILNELNTSRVLHLFAVQLQTADNVIWEAVNNSGLFLGLIELGAIYAKGDQEIGAGMTPSHLLDNLLIIGNVSFIMPSGQSLGKVKQKKQTPLDYQKAFEIGKQDIVFGDDRAGVAKVGNNYIVMLAGSKLGTGREGGLVNPDLETNFENIAGSEEFFKTRKYLKSQRALEYAITEAKKTNGSVRLIGYSLGARIAMSLASRYPGIRTDVYEVPAARPFQKQIDDEFKRLKLENITFHRTIGSPISQHLEAYIKKHKLKLKSYPQKVASSHSLNNFP